MDKFCFSCGMPLSMPGAKGVSEDYCAYCTDSKGNLKSQDEVKAGLAQWLQQWQAGIDQGKALERAAHYMKAMPAWAD